MLLIVTRHFKYDKFHYRPIMPSYKRLAEGLESLLFQKLSQKVVKNKPIFLQNKNDLKKN